VRHAYGRSHTYAGIYRFIRLHGAEGVAADVSRYAHLHIGKYIKYATVRTARAKNGRPGRGFRRFCGLRRRERLSEVPFSNNRGVQFSLIGKILFPFCLADSHLEKVIFNKRLQLLDYKQAVDAVGKFGDQTIRQRINHPELENGCIGKHLSCILIADSGRDNS